MDWHIIQITEGTVLDPTLRQFTATRIVQFTVGKHGPFQVQIPAKEFTSARVRQLLEEQAREIAQLFPGG